MKMKTMMGMLILASVLLGLGGCSKERRTYRRAKAAAVRRQRL